MAGGARIFAFVQWEFPFTLGPADGRYVLRGGDPEQGAEPEHILVLKALAAPERRGMLARRRRPRVEPEPPPTLVPTSRVTLVYAEPLADASAARKWLKEARDDRVQEALAVLNRVLQAHRIATADLTVRPVGPSSALVRRVGYGAGELVADGRWTEARDLPPPSAARQKRAFLLRPQERLAALLGGRDVALACEELALRARQDLDAGLHREAALQLRAATDVALVELHGDQPFEVQKRVEQLQDLADGVEAAAETALRGPLSAQQVEAVEQALGRLEAALRARQASGTA